jgi:hypothetical protein
MRPWAIYNDGRIAYPDGEQRQPSVGWSELLCARLEPVEAMLTTNPEASGRINESHAPLFLRKTIAFAIKANHVVCDEAKAQTASQPEPAVRLCVCEGDLPAASCVIPVTYVASRLSIGIRSKLEPSNRNRPSSVQTHRKPIVSCKKQRVFGFFSPSLCP